MSEFAYSPSEDKFFNLANSYSELPSDLITISENQFQLLIHERSFGKKIVAENGVVRAVENVSTISVEDLRKNRSTFINNERDRVLNQGFVFDGTLFDCDSQASLNLTATVSAVASGIALPPNFTWRSKENQNIQMNGAKIVAFGAAMLSHINTVYARSWALKDLIQNRNTKASINKIDWNTEI